MLLSLDIGLPQAVDGEDSLLDEHFIHILDHGHVASDALSPELNGWCLKSLAITFEW
jgi:hypothetical protein